MTQEQLQKYFDRIDCPGISAPTLSFLSTLQRRHSLTIPFENLNPLLNIPVLLDFETLFHKLIIDKRGGYCYEQNIFFLEILKTLGFTARGLTGRVMTEGRIHPRRTHMLILAEIAGEAYISDVGFGSSSSCTPLLLKTDIVQNTLSGDYRLIAQGNDGFILQTFFNDNWRSLYFFDLDQQFQEDFEVGNWYTSTNSAANFKHNLMMSLKGENCRFTLDNNVFSTYHPDGSKEKQVLKTTDEIRRIMSQTFQIHLNNLPGLDIKLREFIENGPAEN